MRFKTVIASLAAGAALLWSAAADAQTRTFRWAWHGDIASMDPYARRETFTLAFLNHVYEGLVRYNDKLEVEPALAVSWEPVEPTRWRFRLRPNVRFHNGATLTADDVVFSFQRATAENAIFRGNIGRVRAIEKVDDLTVDLILFAPYPILPRELSDFGIMNRAWAVANGADRPVTPTSGQDSFAAANSNGTGAFMLRSREVDVRTVLVRNPNWWDTPRHNLDEVVFRPITSAATRVAAMLAGEIDMMFPVPLQDLQRLQSAPRIRILQEPELRVIFFALNVAREELLDSDVRGRNPLRDLRVRQAMYHAIDIETMRTRVMRGASVPVGTLMAREINGYDPALDRRLPFDQNRARQLLTEAGYPNGFEVGLDCPNDRYVNDEQICTAVVGMLARVGIRVRLNAVPGTQWIAKLNRRESSFYMIGWAGLPPIDAHHFLSNLYATNDGRLGGNNYGGYSNPRVDALTNQIQSEPDRERRQAAITEAFTIVQNDVATIPLHRQPLAWAVREGVQVPQAADNVLRMWYVRMP
jgi:peptide/nickel transport system substrate-binding protein